MSLLSIVFMLLLAITVAEAIQVVGVLLVFALLVAPAARLCAEARPGEILISSRVLYKIEALITCEPKGELSLKGFARPVPAFNVLGLKTG